MYYNEAVFLLAEANTLEAAEKGDPYLISESIDRLVSNYRKLRSNELGYKARYCLEILEASTAYFRFFGRQLLPKGDIDGYFAGAIKTFNSNDGFADAFLGLRALLAYGLNKELSGDKDKAEELYSTVLALAKALSGDELSDAEHELAKQYLPSSQALKKFLYFLDGRKDQLNREKFLLFRATALSRLGSLKIRDDLDKALSLLKEARQMFLNMRSASKEDFFGGAMFMQRMQYYKLLTDISEACLLKYERTKEREHLEKAVETAKEVAVYYAQSKDGLVKDSYLKASLIIALYEDIIR